MEFITIGLISDAIIACLLIATMAYVIRLTLYLKKFKESRDELNGLVQDLAKHITKAEKSVETLHHAADESGQDIQARLNKANMMFDELDMIVQTADSLATRLEELAVRNKKIIDGGESDASNLRKNVSGFDDYDDRVQNIVRDANPKQEQNKTSPFMIRDPEVERGDDNRGDGFTLDDNEVLSDAERDLYQAIQGKKQSKKRG